MVKEIKTHILIMAPAEAVWKVLMDFDNHPKWNPFISHISGGKTKGEKLKVSMKNTDGKKMTFYPEVLTCNPGKEFRWAGKLGIRGLFDGEHYFILDESEPGKTRFLHGEVFSGMLVGLMKSMLDKTKEGFMLMNNSLKKVSENIHEGVSLETLKG